ncbi:MAG: hypothetical protein IIC67_07225 [Thaumarchaeota archaeon]|nr:hypothetical protein [Nitrososphaerota archaeon]
MTLLEERLLQLKSEVEELKITSEDSQIAYDKVKEFRSILGQFDTESEKGKNAYLKGMRTYLDTELNFLRDRANIIRKVSPNTANILEKKINEYDKGTRTLLETAFDKTKEFSTPTEALLGLFDLGKTVYSIFYLREIVEIGCSTLLDTIEYLDGNKPPH